MEFVVKRSGMNTVKVSAGVDTIPTRFTFHEFVDILKGELFSNQRVTHDVRFDMPHCILETIKYDIEEGWNYENKYYLDGLLMNDMRFMSEFGTYLSKYEANKEEIKERVKDIVSKRIVSNYLMRQAVPIYLEYCHNGKLILPEQISIPMPKDLYPNNDDAEEVTFDEGDVALGLINLFRSHDREIYMERRLSALDDPIPRYQYRHHFVDASKRGATTLLGVASAISGVTCFASLGQQDMRTLAGMAGCVVGAILYQNIRYHQDEEDSEKAYKTMDEIADLLEVMYFSEKAENVEEVKAKQYIK